MQWRTFSIVAVAFMLLELVTSIFFKNVPMKSGQSVKIRTKRIRKIMTRTRPEIFTYVRPSRGVR
jgi:hypothetical protein